MIKTTGKIKIRSSLWRQFNVLLVLLLPLFVVDIIFKNKSTLVNEGSFFERELQNVAKMNGGSGGGGNGDAGSLAYMRPRSYLSENWMEMENCWAAPHKHISTIFTPALLAGWRREMKNLVHTKALRWFCNFYSRSSFLLLYFWTIDEQTVMNESSCIMFGLQNRQFGGVSPYIFRFI